jgi:hypothetical protein
MTGAPTALNLKGNEFGKIPNRDHLDYFKPKKIVHMVIQARFVNGTDLEFYIHPHPKSPPVISGEDTIVDYADCMAKVDVDFLEEIVPSPLDIKVKEQCWVVVQLGASIRNFQFMPGGFGCSTKAIENKRNVDLVHAYKDVDKPIGKAGEAVSGDGCRLLYFGVRKRGLKSSVDPANPGSDGFNFHIEIVHKRGTNLEMRLPLIFDPDVKNDSDTNPIPPDGG